MQRSKPSASAEGDRPNRLARPAPVQKRAKERVERILIAVRTIIIRDGFAALTVPTICSEANVAVGSFYQYFPNKEAIAVAFYENYLTRIRASLTDFQQTRLGLGWREYFLELLKHFEREELRDPCIFELTSALRMAPELEEAEARNAEYVCKFFVTQLKRLGAIHDEDKLQRLSRVLYEVHSAFWTFREDLGPKFEQEAAHWESLAVLSLVGTAFNTEDPRPIQEPKPRSRSASHPKN